MNAAPRNFIIGLLAAAALFAGGMLTGQRLWKNHPAGTDSPDSDAEQNAGREQVDRGAANNLVSRIREQEAAVEKARNAMLNAMKKHDAANRDRTGRHHLTLERDLLELSTQLQTLKNLNGDAFFSAAIEMGLGSATIQKLYPEYQAELTTLSAMSHSGFGPNHPKALGLKESIALKSAQLEAAAENLESTMSVQIDTGSRLLADAATRSKGNQDTPHSSIDVQNEYSAAKKLYESELERLERLREASATGMVKAPDPTTRLEVQ